MSYYTADFVNFVYDVVSIGPTTI